MAAQGLIDARPLRWREALRAALAEELGRAPDLIASPEAWEVFLQMPDGIGFARAPLPDERSAALALVTLAADVDGGRPAAAFAAAFARGRPRLLCLDWRQEPPPRAQVRVVPLTLGEFSSPRHLGYVAIRSRSPRRLFARRDARVRGQLRPALAEAARRLEGWLLDVREIDVAELPSRPLAICHIVARATDGFVARRTLVDPARGPFEGPVLLAVERSCREALALRGGWSLVGAKERALVDRPLLALLCDEGTFPSEPGVLMRAVERARALGACRGDLSCWFGHQQSDLVAEFPLPPIFASESGKGASS